MGAFDTYRSELLTAAGDATRGHSDIFVAGIASLPAITAPGAVGDWLYMLAGGDGTGGLIWEARFMSGAPSASLERRAAWRRVYELAVGLREVLRELAALEPEKASCEACEAIEGCSLCDQSGLSFDESRAA